MSRLQMLLYGVLAYISFQTRSLYRYVRHPLIVGFLIAFWATPEMTRGQLLFAAVVTVYVLVALRLEERDLLAYLGISWHILAYHGESYSRYQRQVRMLVPLPIKRRSQSEAAPGDIETEQVRPDR